MTTVSKVAATFKSQLASVITSIIVLNGLTYQSMLLQEFNQTLYQTSVFTFKIKLL